MPTHMLCYETKSTFQENVGVMIIDAGGGTIDISSYYMASSPQTFFEIAPAQCGSTTLKLKDI